MSREIVRISRISDLEPLVCQVRLSTSDCIVASELSESLDLDGLFIIPTKSVRCFDREFEKADFYRIALDAWPDDKRHAALLRELSCSLVDDLRLLGRRSELVAIHMEVEDPDVCYVGTVREVTEEALLLDRISSRGERNSEPLPIEIDSITKVEIGTRYLMAVGYAARVLAAKT